MAAAAHLASLNAPQAAAASHGEPAQDGRFTATPLLVIAGAGTGKTNTLAHRVAHLVLNGVDPARILLLTFTRRAAQEMTRRAEAIITRSLAGGSHAALPAVRLPWAGTFHSVGARLLREHALALGLDPAFSVMDRGDSADLLDLVRHELGLHEKARRFPRKDTCLAIYSHRVNTQGTLEETLAGQFPWCAEWHDDLRALCRGYVERKLAEQALDYDDLLLWWHALVGEPALAAAVSARFDHVLVDEYQDTNTLQADILHRLRPLGEGVTVVGDDAQSIYSFRAATVDNILNFPARFTPPARVVALEDNYRSTQGVLDAANALMAEAAQAHRKNLRAARGAGARPRLVTVADEAAQAQFVVAQVLSRREAGVELRRQAVLFRSAHHSDVLELELVRRNIPYVKYGGLKFLEAAHVKDLLGVLRFADNPRHTLAAFRTLQLLPGFGPSWSGRCLAHLRAANCRLPALESFVPPAAAASDWPGFLSLVLSLAAPETPWEGQVQRVREWYRPHLERRHEAAAVRDGDLAQLEALSGQYADRAQFLTELTLDPPAASGDLAGPPLRDEDYLVLSTVHSAKGQEWEAVILLNFADGNFPSEFAAGDPALLEEERRLVYVAMTRAKDALDLVVPLRYHVTQQAKRGDAHVYGARSRFLTPPVLNCLATASWPPPGPPGAALAPGVATMPTVDVATRLRALW